MKRALFKRLRDKGFVVHKQVPVDVYFEDTRVGEYFADLIVEEKVILELKAVETLHPMHEVQLVNYLKATDIEVGLLVNFGEEISINRRVFSNNQSFKQIEKTA